MSFVRVLAQLFSFVLHPLLMPLYVLFFLFGGGSVFALLPLETKWYCFLVTFVSLVLMPLLSLPFFRYFRLIRNYSLDDKQERIYPILVAVVLAFLGFWFLGKVAYTEIVQQLFLILVILLSAFSVISLRWKISMHMTAIGGVCGFLLCLGIRFPGDIRADFILMLLLAGLLGASRLYLKKHNPLQVYVGFLFGLLFVFLIMM